METEDILDILEASERVLTTGEVVQRAKISRPTARRHLDKMVNSGKVERWDLPGSFLYFSKEGEEE